MQIAGKHAGSNSGTVTPEVKAVMAAAEWWKGERLQVTYLREACAGGKTRANSQHGTHLPNMPRDTTGRSGGRGAVGARRGAGTAKRVSKEMSFLI